MLQDCLCVCTPSLIQVNIFLAGQGSPPLDRYQVAMGFVEVANESMCRPIRSLTQVCNSAN